MEDLESESAVLGYRVLRFLRQRVEDLDTESTVNDLDTESLGSEGKE